MPVISAISGFYVWGIIPQIKSALADTAVLRLLLRIIIAYRA